MVYDNYEDAEGKWIRDKKIPKSLDPFRKKIEQQVRSCKIRMRALTAKDLDVYEDVYEDDSEEDDSDLDELERFDYHALGG